MHRWLVKNILFPLQESLKGHTTLQILADMEVADRLTPAELEELRANKLQQFIRYTSAHVPYVQRMFEEVRLRPADIQTPADLPRLPLMRKEDVRTHRAELRSELAKQLVPFSTGGSSGEPLLFDLSLERISSAVACRQRVTRWWGLSVGDREFALWGSPLEVTRQDRWRRLRDGLMATQLFSAFEMSEAAMSRYADVLRTGHYRMIFGYPSSLYLLCLHAAKKGASLRRAGVKAVFVTGEILFSHQRELISETFDCSVANGYGGRESGFVAHECPQGNMHMMADATIVEIVGSEGRPVPDGECGEIVVTDLYSREAPFLRYATGDIGTISSRKCRCGRPHPLLERIEGRTTDSIVAPDGTTLHALSVIYILREIHGVEQFRIHQKKVDQFAIQVVRNQNYNIESDAQIREALQKRLRSRLEVTIEHVDSLPAEKSGKFRHVVSDVRPEETSLDKAALADGPR